MSPVLHAVWVSGLVIFVAELGDKSQLMALTFATRFRAGPVLAAITAATALVHAGSVVAGNLLGDALPTFWISVTAALAFLGFAVWTVRGDTLNDEEARKASRTAGGVFTAVFVAFLLSELGDKTMLATVTLATREDVLGTWIGSTVGMVAADALAILVGRQLGRHLPERAIRFGAAGLFVLFGLWLLVEALLARW
jgi:putative Ca2+/H+ antiporter (TMEM165/GDT1 family)